MCYENLVVETVEYKGYVIKIMFDNDPLNPRKEWDNVGKLVCFHPRYNLGDEGHGFYSPEDLIEYLEENPPAAMLNLYLYDHSGITMRYTPFSDPWDSGQVGIAFISREDAIKEWGNKILTKAVKEKALNYLKGEVETYDQYLTGEVYGYEIYSVNDEGEEEFEDSCWGFFGEIEYAITEAKEYINAVLDK